MNIEKNIPPSKILESLTNERPRRAKFWRMFHRASMQGKATRQMLEYGEALQEKQDRGVKLFNWIKKG